MTKVKIISDTNRWDVEERINEFLSDHNVSNIKYQTNGENQVRTVYSAMIIYEE